MLLAKPFSLNLKLNELDPIPQSKMLLIQVERIYRLDFISTKTALSEMRKARLLQLLFCHFSSF